MKTMLPNQRASCFETLPRGTLEVETEEQSPAVVVIRLHGEAASNLVDDLTQQLKQSVGHAGRFVILDLAGLRSICGTTLQTLVEFRRLLAEQGGDVWLAGLQPAVWLALRWANPDELFTRPPLSWAGPADSDLRPHR